MRRLQSLRTGFLVIADLTGYTALAIGVVARIAGWCHSGHCAESTTELPRLIGERRADIANRIAGLQALDARLAGLQGHLDRPRRSLPVMDATGPCCEAAGAVVGSSEGGCSCCSVAPTS
jgi:hypothetical protein